MHSGMIVEVQSPFLLQLVRVVPLISNPFSQVKVHFEPILRKSFQIFWKNEILVIFKFSRSVALQSDERSSPFRTREHKRLCNSRVVFAPYEKNMKTFLWPLSSSPVQLINPFRGVGNKSQWLFVRTVLKKASVLPNTRISRIYLYRVNPHVAKIERAPLKNLRSCLSRKCQQPAADLITF